MASTKRPTDIELLKGIFSTPDFKRVLPGLALSSTLINLFALALPLGILQFLDRVVTNQSYNTLTLLTIGIVLAMALEMALQLANSHVAGWLGARREHFLGMNAVERLMRIQLRVLEREDPIKHAERVGSASLVSRFFAGQSLLLLFDIPFVLLFLFVIFLIDVWVLVVALVLLLVFMVVSTRMGLWLRSLIENRYRIDERRYSFLVDMFNGMRTVKTHAMEAQMERRYEMLQASNADMTAKLTYGNAITGVTGLIFSSAMIVCVVSIGGWGVVDGRMTPGELAACMLLSVRALRPLRRSLKAWVHFQAYRTAQERLQEIEVMPAGESQTNRQMPALRQGIELRDLKVINQEGKPVLDGLSMTVRAGECVAIRGESGSGKTCLMTMLNGLDSPGSGEVLLDGVPIADFDTDSVQGRIALLPQKNSILAGTILENITMFDESRNEAAIDIAKQLGLDQIVAGLKLGYETPLGEGNAETLPQGVRQIISLARALMADPDVILLDESNLSLDMKADQQLREVLEKRKGKATMVMVTHRPSYLAMADRIFNLKNGKLHASADSGQAGMGGQGQQAEASLPARPQHTEDISRLVDQHFSDPSDFSNCLAPMLAEMRWRGGPAELSESLPHVMRRLDLSGFCDSMSNLGLFPQHFPSALKHLDGRLTPCLAVADGRPALVVLERLEDGRLRCHDGGNNREVVLDPSNELVEIFVFRAANKAVDEATRKTSSWFGRLFVRFRKMVLLAFLLGVIGTLLTLSVPLFVRTVFDRVLISGDLQMHGFMFVGVVIVWVLVYILMSLKGRLVAHIGGRTDYLLGVSIVRRILGLPTSLTDGATVNRQIIRLRNFESARDFITGPLAFLGIDLPASLIILVVLAFFNPWSLLVIGSGVVAYIVLIWLAKPIARRATIQSSQAAAEEREYLIEMITQMRLIRGTGHRHDWLDHYRERSAKAALAHYREHKVQSGIDGAADFIGSLTAVLTVAMSVYLVMDGTLTIGGMVATMLLVWRLIGPLKSAFMAFVSLLNVRSNMQQIENLLKMPSEREGNAKLSLRPQSVGAISFSRVSFRYTNDADPALIGASLSIAPGQFVVVTGPSGAGKSTLFRLIERTHNPQAGVIRLDQIDIRQLTVTDLRSRLAYMPQESELFYGSVTQNLRLGYPSATDEEVEWAIDVTGLRKYVDSLPEGAQTRINNSMAMQMPYSFKQQLILARTILKPAAVVMLDEPANGLDDSGEEALLRCIAWLRKRSTVIMISPRPSHMRMADMVVYMERGAVAASGSYDGIKNRIMAGMQA
jgi:ATP-binding cassette subfamily B protein